MKNFCITFSLLFIIFLSICFYSPSSENVNGGTEYLRIHVRANSNGANDQSVKYKVKDAVVQFVTPYVATCKTKQQSLTTLASILTEIEDVCEKTLNENGFYYGATAKIKQELFPTRVYEDVVLEQGVYDALIINLGEGAGDNWWCVIYPPLCFSSSGTEVRYRSAILDIINSFFNK